MNKPLNVILVYKEEENECSELENELKADLAIWFANLMNNNFRGKENERD